MLDFFKKYFTISSQEWATTVRICLIIGFVVGLFIGLVVLLKLWN